jgi:hypothetical protein
MTNRLKVSAFCTIVSISLGLVHIQLLNISTVYASEPNILKVLDHYWVIEQALSQDTLTGVRERAELIIPAARSVQDKVLSNKLQNDAKLLADSAGAPSGHGSLEEARQDFRVLSATLSAHLKYFPASDWQIVHCSMADADWIQKKGSEVKNPYYGKKMSSCGEKI